MKSSFFKSVSRAQTGVEYLMILTVVGVIVLVSFRVLVPRIHTNAETYYTSVTDVILGNHPGSSGSRTTKLVPVDGGWCEVKCPPKTASAKGNPKIYRTCECPAPAFGGKYCTESQPGNRGVDNNCIGDTCTCDLEPLPGGACIPDGRCSALEPQCGEVTIGQDSCGGACTRQGPACPHN